MLTKKHRKLAKIQPAPSCTQLVTDRRRRRRQLYVAIPTWQLDRSSKRELSLIIGIGKRPSLGREQRAPGCHWYLASCNKAQASTAAMAHHDLNRQLKSSQYSHLTVTFWKCRGLKEWRPPLVLLDPSILQQAKPRRATVTSKEYHRLRAMRADTGDSGQTCSTPSPTRRTILELEGSRCIAV